MIRLKPLLEDIPMGDVAFGESPHLAKFQGKPEEDNTEAENALYKLLKQWFEGNTGAIGRQGEYSGYMSDKFLDIKSDLFKLKTKFPKIFDPGDTKYAYRGSFKTDNSQDSVYNLINNSKTIYLVEKHLLSISDPIIAIPYSYNPKSAVQSWSAVHSVAIGFANAGLRTLSLVTKVDDSFIMSPFASNEISGLRESEILHFGKDIDTFLCISSYNADNIFNTLYEILEGLPSGALNDSDEDMVDAVLKHKNFNTRCKLVSNYDNLPW